MPQSDGIGGIPPYFMPETWGGPKGYATIRPVLVADRVRCVGDHVAYVVAETEAQARDAAELVEVKYAELPAVIGVEEATKPRHRQIWEELSERQCGRDDCVRRQGSYGRRFCRRRGSRCR